jgi:hypothetical protein
MLESPRLPGAPELASVLTKVLEEFAYLPATPREGVAGELRLNVRASIPGTGGWLVLRGTPGLARQLADGSTGGSGEDLDLDAFYELCNLSASHLTSEIHSGHAQGWKAVVPEFGLPEGRPSAKVLLDVEGEPLEAAFWSAA